MDYEEDSLEGKLDNDDDDLVDEEEIESEDNEDDDEKRTASDVRRKIEDYLEKRSFLKELGDDLMDVDDVDWVTD